MSMSGFMQQLSQQAGNMNPPLSAAERAQRSVFVGNIPYEATEEQLKDIFAQAGPVVSFRLVYDRETGKPKGYGFCEYQDVETAQSSMRNLNNHDFNGRPLRVGVAAGDQSKDEMKGLQQAIGGPPVESPYGAVMETEKAPEAISQAVASLPPEQMFELMKQMKLCIQNNPNEARNMLLQNPQLAYALLQAQIVMKIVDPQVALAMLHRESNQIPPPIPTSGPPQGAPQQTGPPSGQMGMAGGPLPGIPPQRMPGYMGEHPREMMPGRIRDERPMDMMGAPRPMQGMAPRGPMPDMGRPYAGPRPDMHDPRMRDPHAMPGPSSLMHAGIPASLGSNLAAGLAQLPKPGTQISAQDQEKANLIMQVLQLTEEQIAMLPPEQRQSILILKDQISQSSH